MNRLLGNKPKAALFLAAILLFSLLLASCGGTGASNSPVTLTMWHNFSGNNREVTDGLINEFNETVGKEEGIVITVTSLSSSSEQNDKLEMIAAGDSGAPEMPDMVTAYPAMAVTLSTV